MENQEMNVASLYHDYIDPILKNKLRVKINNSLVLKVYQSNLNHNTGHSDIQTTWHYLVIKDGIIVLNLTDNGIYKYNPGNWENEIIDYYKNTQENTRKR